MENERLYAAKLQSESDQVGTETRESEAGNAANNNRTTEGGG